ncbi:MAG TPA: SPFH domain-containing protein [Burkholderiales bacterium]|nr:SPFH domain-containing protein [Burkholderiales bacterium]
MRFIRTQPTQYVIQYRNGKPVREGAGLSFFYFSPTASLVLVPTASEEIPFIFHEVTADFQEITIQGQVTYRVADPRKLAGLLNYALDAKGSYVSDDPKKLSSRLVNQIQVLLRAQVQGLSLRNALGAGDNLVLKVRSEINQDPTVAAMGLEILGLSILAIKPQPETARALEAEVREKLLREADQAVYERRNAAVNQERGIKENELATEVAVENKKRQIREAQMDAERAVQQKKRQMREEEMATQIGLEEQKKSLVSLATENAKEEADAKAYSLAAVVKVFAGVDAKVLQALTSAGMEPAQLMALAFRDIADGAGKIGQLNLSPDLLREIMKVQPAKG